MSGWTTAWLLWIAMFFVIEMPAVFNKRPGDTLSEHIWAWFAIKDKPKGWRMRRLTLIAALAWLVLHLLGVNFV
jgi:hypothetical protein